MTDLVIPSHLRGPVLWLLQWALSDLAWDCVPDYDKEPTEEEIEAVRKWYTA